MRLKCEPASEQTQDIDVSLKTAVILIVDISGCDVPFDRPSLLLYYSQA